MVCCQQFLEKYQGWCLFKKALFHAKNTSEVNYQMSLKTLLQLKRIRTLKPTTKEIVDPFSELFHSISSLTFSYGFYLPLWLHFFSSLPHFLTWFSRSSLLLLSQKYFLMFFSLTVYNLFSVICLYYLTLFSRYFSISLSVFSFWVFSTSQNYLLTKFSLYFSIFSFIFLI